MLRLNRLQHPVTVLGWGTRAGVWVQGCSIGCGGCASRDTWSTAGGASVAPEAVVEWLAALPGPLDGVTVSGGEPFEQPGPLTALLRMIDEWRAGRQVDVLVYSGLAWPRLAATPAFSAALASCDAVVAGPYVERRNTGTPLRGSENQRVVALTALGRSRYPDERPSGHRPQIQVAVSGGRIHLVGIPARGDLDRVREELGRAGIELDDVTWGP